MMLIDRMAPPRLRTPSNLMLLVGTIVLLLLLRPPAARPYAVAFGAGEADVLTSGFWPPEGPAAARYRWTDGDSSIALPGLSSSAWAEVALVLAAPTPAPQPLAIWADNRQVATLMVAPGWRRYRLLVGPSGPLWRAPQLRLLSPTAQPPGDGRTLGVAVQQLSVRPAGARLPLEVALRAALVLALVLAVFTAVRRAAPPAAAATAALLAGAALVALWRALPGDSPLSQLPALWPTALCGGLLAALLARAAQPHAAQAERRALLAWMLPLGLVLLVRVLQSLDWRMVHDAPLLMYCAFLIDRFHAVPYRDFFDQNMLGTYAIYLLVGKLFGYSDAGFRLADVLLLSMIAASTYAAMRPFGRAAGWCAALLFSLAYLSYGQEMSMQREYLLLLPLSLALNLLFARPHTPLLWRAAGVGVCVALMASIKPHALIGYPVLLLALLAECGARSARGWRGLAVVLATLAGAAVPALLLVGTLWVVGGLPAFLEMSFSYLPLFAHISGYHDVVSEGERLRRSAEEYLALGKHWLWLLPAGLGGWLALRRAGATGPQRRAVLVLAGLALCYSLYPIAAGRFYAYHWLIFLYVLLLLSALMVVARTGRGAAGQLLPLALLSAVLLLRLGVDQADITRLATPKLQRVDAISAALQGRLRAGDTVQPLDWTGGALHAMLRAEAAPATPFVYDFYFYHDVDHPFIQRLRARLLAELAAAPPRFVIQIESDKPWISGPGTTRSFPALEQFLGSGYVVAQRGAGYTLYERRAPLEP